ncbi:MAG: hypothetical protein LUD17_11835 [Bacteroidales bacterium]|nr:hypothetical protein [Bacteroidales bacterium]
MRSIDKVNIGAFPLRPARDGAKDGFLRCFLARIIGKSSIDTLLETIPQRGLEYSETKTSAVLLVVYAKEQLFETFKARGFCYVRTGGTEGAIDMHGPHPDHPEYLLLHNGPRRELFRIIPNSGNYKTKRKMKEDYGFEDNKDPEKKYLVYEFDTTEIPLWSHIDWDEVVHRGKATPKPFFTTIPL